MIVFRHYIKRILTEPITMLIFLLLPAALVGFNTVVNLGFTEGYDHIVNGRDMVAGSMAVLMLIMFQFMGGTLVIEHIYLDLKSDRRWRLRAAPVSISKIVFSMAFANIVFSVISGSFILAVGYIFFNAHYPNLLVIFALLIILSVLSSFMGMLIAMFTPKKGAAEAIVMAITWGMVIPAGLFGAVNLGSALDRFFNYITPYAQALRAANHTGFGYNNYDMRVVAFNLLTLVGTTVVLGIITAIVSRRRSF